MASANDLIREVPTTLEFRYTAEKGTVFLTGVQALLRVMLDQSRADRCLGLKTAGLVSGYPGSPLGGVDLELGRHAQVFAAGSIHHQLGVNEELAATAIYGTQLIHNVPDAKFDGVFGLWFGKAPGVERAADAIHHANFHGVARNGGVLAVAGDDPHARSTILPSDSNTLFSSFYMPVLAPGNVQEVLDLGRHGFALSRAAGLWVGFKFISDVADSAATVQVGIDRVQPRVPSVEFDGNPLEPGFRPNEAGPPMLEREREIVYGRLELARQYGRINGLNQIVVDGANAKRGILAAGKSYYDLREALSSLGLDDAALAAANIRILKMNMIFPFDHEIAVEFGAGLEEVLVVEDKRPFLEGFLKQALYGCKDPPRIVGKYDARGMTLLTASGELSSDAIRRAVAIWLGIRESGESGESDAARSVIAPPTPAALSEWRTPYFCSGCPHNRALRVPAGSVVGAGIGCHIMTLWMGEVFGEVTGYTQMGGEGAQWVGLRPFTGVNHFFQNLGDGTYAHSGSLAIRFAVAADTNVTYKILYNSAVAMTGGQSVFGGKSVAGIIDEVLAEGVKKVVVTTDQPERYAGLRLPSNASVRHRDQLVDVERDLSAVKGVTVLINDQQCAAEKRRLRKRGRQERPARRVVINERICEGCGDCGAKSNCLSVEPIDTEFGRKTRINQSSCNQDYSCLLGDCPSFTTIEGAPAPRAEPLIVEPDLTLDAPINRVPEGEFSVFMAGIGGTGVITVNQILGVAAMLAGKHVAAIDQIGSSQKAGPVVSHLKISDRERLGACRIMSGAADVFLAFDMLCAAEASNLAIGDHARTVLVANVDEVPTGGTVSSVERTLPRSALLRERLESVTRDDRQFINALAISRAVLGSEVAANMITVGAAYQMGALPLPLAAIEAAIRLNGTAVDMNLQAFRWGRYAVQAPERVRAALAPASSAPEHLRLDAALESRVRELGLAPSLESRVRLRVGELCSYQDSGYARRYLDFLHEVHAAEVARYPARTAITEAVAIGYHKFMAYKDEYEVARLIVDAYDHGRASGAVGNGMKLRWHLHPTFLRSVGVHSKVALGRWFIPVARLLARMKMLRGTRADFFGATKVRRLERNLIVTYHDTMLRALQHLNDGNYLQVATLARLPELVRGYEDIKVRSIQAFEERRTQLLCELENPRVAVAA